MDRYESAKAQYAALGVDTDAAWFDEIRRYEKDVLAARV